MAPRPRHGWPDGFNAARLRHAAGLLLLFPVDQQAHVEVQRILEAPVATLLDPATLTWLPLKRGDLDVDAPAFVTHDVIIWGATAMVLGEFLTLLGWPREESTRS